MKLFRSIIYIFFISCFIACSTSDDQDSAKSGDLVGTWELRSEIEYDEDGEVWEEETYEPGSAESIMEVDQKFITFHEEETLFDGQAIVYQYDPSEKFLIYFGFRIDVEWLGPNTINFIVENAEGKTVSTWVRI